MCDRAASPSTVKCVICDRNVNKRELEDHIIRQHIQVNLEHFACRICSIARDSWEEIIEHVTIAKHLPRENIIRKKRIYAVKLVERIMSDCFESSSAKLASKSSDKYSNRPLNHHSDDHHHQRPPSGHEKDRNGKADDGKHQRRGNDENDRNKKKRSSLDKEDEKEQRDSSHHRRGRSRSKSHERGSGVSEHQRHDHHHHRSRHNDHISADRRKLVHIHSHYNVVAVKPLSPNKHDGNRPSSFDDRRDKTTSDRDNHSSSSNNNNQRRTSRPPLLPTPPTNSTTTSHRSTTHADPSLSSAGRHHGSSISSRGGGKKAESEEKSTDREAMRQAEIVVSKSSTSISQTKAAPSSTASDIVFDSAATASAQPSSTFSSGNWLIDRCGNTHQPVGRMDQQILSAQNWTTEKQRVVRNDNGDGDRGTKRSRCDMVDVRCSQKSGKLAPNASSQPSTSPISTNSTNQQQQQPEDSASSRQRQKRRSSSQSSPSFPSADLSGGSTLNNNNHTEISANSSNKQPSSPDNDTDSTPADGGSFEWNKRRNNKTISFSPTSSSSAYKINNHNNSSALNDNNSSAASNLKKSPADLTNFTTKQSTGGNDQNPKSTRQSTSSAAVIKNSNRVRKKVQPKHMFFRSSSSSEDSSSDGEGGGNDRYLNGQQTTMVPSPLNDRNLTMVKCKLCPNELPIKNLLNQKLGHVKWKHLSTLRLNCQFCPYSGLMGDDLVRHMDSKHSNRLGGRSQQASLLDVDQRAEILKSFKACFPHSEIPPNSRNSVRPNDIRRNASGSGGGGTPEIGMSHDSRPATHVTTADRRRKDRKRPHPVRKDSKSSLSDSMDVTPASRQSRSESKSKDDDQSSKSASPPTNVDAVVDKWQALKNNHQLERRLASLSVAKNCGQSKSTGKKSLRGDEESSDVTDEGGVHCNQCQAVVVDLFVARKKHTNEAHFNGEEQTSSNLTDCWSTGFFELFRRCWPEERSTENLCALCRKNVESKSGKASHVARYHYQKAIKCPVCKEHEELFTSEMLRHIVDEHEGLMQISASGQTIDVNKRGMYRPPQTWTDGNNLKILECFPRRVGPYHYRRTTTNKAEDPYARLTENLLANGPSVTSLPPLDYTKAVARNSAPAVTANIAAESSAVPIDIIGDSSRPPADAKLQSAETTKRHRNRADQVNRERMEWKCQQQNEQNCRNRTKMSGGLSASGKKRRQKSEEKAALSIRVGGNETLGQEPDLKIVDEILEIRAVQAIIPGHSSVVDDEISVIYSDTNAAATAPSSSSGRLWGPPGSSPSVSVPIPPSNSAGKGRTRRISTSKSGKSVEVSGYCKGCGKNFDKDLLENHHLAFDHIWANHMNFISAPRVCTLCPFRAYSMNHITAHLLSQHSIRVMVGKDADYSHSNYRTEMSPDETLETQCQLERCFGLEWDESGQRMIRINGVSE